MKAYFYGGSKPVFDFRDIRPKGARLVTSGGKAPGPQPLKECLIKLEGILETKKDGDKLRPIEVHDMVCHIADAVLAGGIRRAALISLFSASDDEMISCKSGAWWETNPQRGRANNSVSLMRHKITKDYFMDLWKRIENSGAGEPGIYLSNDKDWGTNPCCEIALRPFQFCNLCEVNVSDVVDQNDLNARVKAAAFIGTLQAGYTDFHYLRPIWARDICQWMAVGSGANQIAYSSDGINWTGVGSSGLYSSGGSGIGSGIARGGTDVSRWVSVGFNGDDDRSIITSLNETGWVPLTISEPAPISVTSGHSIVWTSIS